jgi:predicted metalloprotease with PDZ domain
MKRLSCALAGVLLSAATLAGGNTYRYSVDLTQVKDDKIQVELLVPAVQQEEVTFFIPRIIPGTYSIYNFGRFISGLHAYDESGAELTVSKPDINSWKIAGARRLHKLVYQVEDTWDTSDTTDFVFEPAGTNISDKHFLLNAGGMFGYLDGMKALPYELSVTKPAGFYGSTALIPVSSGSGKDVFTIPSYMDLVDSPIMYTIPDTTTIDVGGSEVLVSVYSPTKQVSSSFVASKIREILFAARNYLGGKLPINRYAFLISLHEGKSGSGGEGALEHSYSSVYYLPDINQEEIAQSVKDVATHEFYHIITPLAIHSEEIGNFDYQNPRMSKHLWLYEGVTEYTAHFVQAREGLLTLDQYMDVMKNKIFISRTYYNDTLPFTVMSKNCLDVHKNEYGNVYQKGALIAFCLDVKLRRLSGGKTGLQDLVNQLALRYGKNNSFRDEDLFAEITALTYPEIGEFLKKHVEGSTPLPLEEVFGEIGYVFRSQETVKDFSLGGAAIGFDYPKRKNLFVVNTDNMDEFGRKLGYKVDDEVIALNGQPITPQNVGTVRKNWQLTLEEGDKVKIKVLRKNKKGEQKEVVLKARARKVDVLKRNTLHPAEKPSPEQTKLRNQWLGRNT